jgi:hypothetical protein
LQLEGLETGEAQDIGRAEAIEPAVRSGAEEAETQIPT